MTIKNLILLLLFCGPLVSAPAIWPEAEWQQHASPEEAGLSRAGVDNYVAWLRSKAEGEPFGTLIVRGGKIVCESYGSGATAASMWEIGSIRKSVMSALLGMAIRDAKLTLDTPAYEVWPQIHTLTGADKDKRIRVRHLATNTSGWMTEAGPGEAWLYNNAACTAGGMVLGRVFEAPDDLVAPLVMERVARMIHAGGWRAYHFEDRFTAGSHGNPGPKLAIDSNLRDLARYGYLWLRGGEWNGRQVIPKEYVLEATSNQAARLGAHYGYWWFTNDGRVLLPAAPEDAFYHVGNGREDRRTVLLVAPSLDLVAVVGAGARTYDLTKGYKEQPVVVVNEWISKVLEAIETRR